MPPNKPHILPEARTNKECLNPSLIDEKLSVLTRAIEERVGELTAVEALAKQSVRIGSKEIPIFPYKYFERREGGFQFTKQEYFAYVSSLTETPSDVVALINEPFMSWTERGDKFDPLLDPPEILGGGGGDCDNISWTAKTLLDTLGCRNGHDYKARVIGFGAHALCIYHNEDGQWWAIDQWDHHPIDLQNIRTASSMFSGPDSSLREISLQRPGLAHHVYIDLHTLEPDHTRLDAVVNGPFNASLAPADVFPEDWKTYEKTQIFFRDGSIMVYLKGYLYEVLLPPSADSKAPAAQFYNQAGLLIGQKLGDGTQEHFSETGVLIQRDFPSPNPISVLLYHDDGVTPLQCEYRDGTIEDFSETGTLIYQRFPSPNPIEILFYRDDGKTPRQCNYRESVDKTKYPYQIVFYAEDGTTIVQTKDWEGKVELQ